ncbi:Hypothetical predicted protein [Paramuricea clavata]|uniref:Uncharacterized protein n=1 Tax=Paramuricea clavata TaxID=317549 RepID=A0A7D9EH41_PARCT|nr:Hypothetical predicted protein [Paramuricea clavata]
MGLELLLLKTLLLTLPVLSYADGNSTRELLIPKEECEKISSVEVRYNEFYELYLGHSNGEDDIHEHGIIYQSLIRAVNACCPGMALNFTLVNRSAESLVQEDILHHHDVQNSSHLIFYFPEFTPQGNLGTRKI